MTPLHAPDPMGKASHKAAMLVTRMDARLLAASSPTLTREDRAASLTMFFRQWRALARAVAELEAIAPGCAERGYDQDALALEAIEGRAT